MSSFYQPSGGYPQMGGYQGFGMPFMGNPFGMSFMGGQFGNPYMQPYGGFGNPYQQMYGNPYQQMYGNPYQQFGNPYGGYGQMYQNPYQQFYRQQQSLLGETKFNPYSQPGIAANLGDISFATQVVQPVAEPGIQSTSGSALNDALSGNRTLPQVSQSDVDSWRKMMTGDVISEVQRRNALPAQQPSLNSPLAAGTLFRRLRFL